MIVVVFWSHFARFKFAAAYGLRRFFVRGHGAPKRKKIKGQMPFYFLTNFP